MRASDHGRMEAIIAGRFWHAHHVDVCRRNGFVAVTGGDESITVALAVPLDAGTVALPIEVTPANALLVVGEEVLSANGERGHGAIVVRHLTRHRLAGSFTLLLAGSTPILVQVTNGSFDVPL
jgi:hypothetical protein